jgi:hypothetical protein
VPGLRSACHDDPALEGACDSIAAELLMPSAGATTFIRSLGQPSPEKLKAIASKYSVSLRMAAIRVHADLRLWKCFVGLWDRYPEVKVAWFVGRRFWDRVEPDAYSLDLALSSATSVQSREWWQRGSRRDSVWLNMLRISNGRVLGLIDFVN